MPSSQATRHSLSSRITHRTPRNACMWLPLFYTLNHHPGDLQSERARSSTDEMDPLQEFPALCPLHQTSDQHESSPERVVYSHVGARKGLIFGVQKSRPARPSLLNALASVLTTDATSRIKSSSKAAPIKMGSGKDVAYLKSPVSEKLTPGESATPCRASFHQVYAGSPSLGTPGDVDPVLLIFSCQQAVGEAQRMSLTFSASVNSAINALALVTGSGF